MASNITVDELRSLPEATREKSMSRADVWLWRIVLFPASLKLTLILLLCAIFLVLVGTLAQAKLTLWDVLRNYFRPWVAWVELQACVPRAWFPKLHDSLKPGVGFPFPGGASIGLGMMINLLFAHAFKFTLVRTSATKFIAGLLALALGVVITVAVIALGQYRQGLSDFPLFTWQTTANAILLGASVITVATYGLAGVLTGLAYVGGQAQRRPQAWLAIFSALVATAIAITLYVFRNDVGAVRILWQLVQGTVAGVVLLVGCWLLFSHRAGIVLVHAGIALMMLGEAYVSWGAKEQQMQIAEGETAVFAHDIRTFELAVIEQADDEETHTVIPEAILLRSWQARRPGAQRITDARLPFDLEVNQFLANARLVDPPKGSNLATTGLGLEHGAESARVGAGADGDAGVDTPAAYITLFEKGTDKSIGTYFVSLQLGLANMVDHIKLGGKTYDLALRFEREYKPYNVRLHDVRKEDYPGSNTPRSYESTIQMVDPTHNVDRRVLISMNNPFRYGGETFYQSGFMPAAGGGKETTTLQVVTNTGWMIPYVSCMVVLVGLAFQFGRSLLQFLEKEQRLKQVAKASNATTKDTPSDFGWRWFVPSPMAYGCVALTLLVIGAGMSMPKAKPDQFDYFAFGKIPVISGGRAKPLDSLARETLLAMSNRVTYKETVMKDGEEVDGKSQPASRWLLETLAKPEEAEKLRVIRIENQEVAEALGLKLRPDFRYSVAEIRAQEENYRAQVTKLKDKNKDEYGVFEKKLLELDRRLQSREQTAEAFQFHDWESLLGKVDARSRDPETQEKLQRAAGFVVNLYQQLNRMQAPLAIPIQDRQLQQMLEGKKWLPLTTAYDMDVLRSSPSAPESETRNAFVEQWRKIVAAYRDNKPAEFNAAVAKYNANMAELSLPDCHVDKVDFEAFFNQFGPFGWTQGLLLYLLAMVVSLCGLLFARRNLGSAAFWMLLTVFLLHTFALVARMYIAGRPPVTNLYSSAVFIGWATVALGLILEGAFRLGVGNVLASVGGAASLLIAYNLSFEGDTIGVMVAVLDTQFWLATHVVCITLGYAATFAAGLLGICYIFVGLFTNELRGERGKTLARMIYGVVCFALLLSFFGTVLGGLWADDSWGRFWGWDPKENGALIIVLWNAFILHARWDRLANERGLAILAVFGNVVTCWSWFGTNQLGVGLHSYGFTQGVLVALGIAVFVHLAIVGLGMIPRSRWSSFAVKDLTTA